MPKKSATARGGAQRPRQREKKLITPVIPENAERNSRSTQVEELDRASATTATPVETTAPNSNEEAAATPVAASKGSAAARLAARRQAAKAQQRNAPSLLTAEHFTYVRKDLITIAILASIMFAAIIVLYIMYGQGA